MEFVFSNEPSPTGDTPVVAEDLSELYEGLRVFEEDEETNLQKVFGFLGFKGSHKRLGLVQETSRSKTITGSTWAEETWGIAIRLVVATDDWHANVGITVPAVAATIELGLANASAALEVRGYTGDYSSLLPTPTGLNVETYAVYISAFGKLQKQIFADPAHQVPQLLQHSRAPAPST